MSSQWTLTRVSSARPLWSVAGIPEARLLRLVLHKGPDHEEVPPGPRLYGHPTVQAHRQVLSLAREEEAEGKTLFAQRLGNEIPGCTCTPDSY